MKLVTQNQSSRCYIESFYFHLCQRRTGNYTGLLQRNLYGVRREKLCKLRILKNVGRTEENHGSFKMDMIQTYCPGEASQNPAIISIIALPVHENSVIMCIKIPHLGQKEPGDEF